MSLFLFLVIVAFVLGLIGAVADGLAWVLALGCVVFAADLVFGFLLLRGRARHRPIR